MKKIMLNITDTFNIFMLRLRMIFRSASVILSFVIAALITGILVNSFLAASEERSSIPVGIIDLDKTDKSRNVIDEIKALDMLYVMEGDMDSLRSKLVDNEIYIIIQINENFEENIMGNNNDNKMFTVYYPKGNRNMAIMSDIAISQVMDEVCYYTCYNTYRKYSDTYDVVDEAEYRAYTDNVYETCSGMVDFNFEILNVDKNQEVTDNITNGLLYRFVFTGIVTILISFIILFSSNAVISDKTYNTDKRINISLISAFAKNTGDLLALFVTGELYVVIACVLMFKRLELTSVKEKLVMFAAFSILCFIISILFMIITKFIREAVMLQIIGALAVCMCGITGTMELLALALNEGMKKIINLSPNVYVMRVYNRLVILGDSSGPMKDFVIYALIMTLLFYIIVFAKEFYLKHIARMA